MSRLVCLATACFAACGVARAPAEALTSSSAAGSAAQVEEEANLSGAPGDQLSANECQRPWPLDSDDPRVGIYVYDPRTEVPDRPDALPFLFFDGYSVTHFGHGEAGLHRGIRGTGCSYSPTVEAQHHLESSPPRRYHARVDGDGWLFYLHPCFGWVVVGAFTGDAFETPLGIMRKLPVGAREELARSVVDRELGPEDVEPLFQCRPMYESQHYPVPALPRPPRHWLRWRHRRQR